MRRGSRSSWRHRRRTKPAEIDSIDPPLRCPACVTNGELPRLDSFTSSKARAFLRKGQAFVAPASSTIGEMVRWDFEHLARHLPPTQRFDVFKVVDRLVMSHSLRYGVPASADGGSFERSAVSALTFAEFLAATEAYEATRSGGRPYLGVDLLRRATKRQKDLALGQVGSSLAAELRTFRMGDLERAGMPPMSAIHLFVGSRATCYHCHYDLNPNLHFQLSGRKRFIIFPPEDWPCLYPYPVHHDLDRRSQVDLDKPDDARFPRWREARGMIVELNPGDCLYIPPLWWHHVQTLTTPCVSMAVWFYDDQPMVDRDLMPSSGAAAHLAALGGKADGFVATVDNGFGGMFFGLSAGAASLSLTRWAEQVVAMYLVDDGADGKAGARAQDSGEAYAGDAKEHKVAAWMRQLGKHARGEAMDDERGLPALKEPFVQVCAAIEATLRADLGGRAERVGPWLRALVHGRFRRGS